MAVDVHVNGGGAPEPTSELLARGVRGALDAEGADDGEVSVTLLSDDEIRALNHRYLDRDRVTDVIAFALHDEGEPVLGDVYVGHEQAARQAAEHGVSRDEELLRLAVHGTLHVLGHVHPEGPEREESPMFRRQEELVRRILEADPSG